jgi:hypothetical protein
MPTLRLRPELEDAVRRIQGVRAASVITLGDGRPTEIHVLAAPGRAPKQIVRDIQSLAMAQFDLELDHRIVSIVQLDDADLAPAGHQQAPGATHQAAPEPVAPTPTGWEPAAAVEAAEVVEVAAPAPEVIDLRDREPVALSVVAPASAPRSTGSGANGSSAAARVMLLPDALAAEAEAAQDDEPAPRPAISSIMVRTSNGETEATVAVGAGGHSFEGREVGPAGPGHRPRLVAQATVNAVGDLLGQSCEVESATLLHTGARTVAVTVVAVQTPRLGEQVLSGSAVVRGDEADAVARSVLDALNRRIAR